jgi:PAS domain S-box-containing protein
MLQDRLLPHSFLSEDIPPLRHLLENLLESAPLGIMIHDFEGHILAFNRELEAITGYTSSEIEDISTWIEKLYPEPAYRQIVLKERQASQPPNILREREAVITHRDGSKRLCQFISRQNESGVRTVFIRPQTTVKELKTQEAHYRDLVELIPEAIYESDPSGQIVFLNQAGMKKFGVTADDLKKGLRLESFLQPEDRKRATANLRRLLAGENIGPDEYLAVFPDGRTLPYMVHSRPMVRDGKVVGAQGVIVDITVAKHTQASLESAKDVLELVLRERTGELVKKDTELNEANTALRVLLRECEMDNQDLQEKITANVKEFILPSLERLKLRRLPVDTIDLIGVLEQNILHLISPFGRTLGSSLYGLSSVEMRVADLTRLGMTSKEISQLMGLSFRTIDTHRRNIRRKLGLQDSRQTLRQGLLKMEAL